jgi:hypothetical protein
MKKRKSKRTKGQEEARPFEGLSKAHQNAAGVEIGATEIVACVPDWRGSPIGKSLWELHGGFAGAPRVVLQAWDQDGGHGEHWRYWIPLFEELERQGFECLLMSSRSLRKVAGQKTDVEDT